MRVRILIHKYSVRADTNIYLRKIKIMLLNNFKLLWNQRSSFVSNIEIMLKKRSRFESYTYRYLQIFCYETEFILKSSFCSNASKFSKHDKNMKSDDVHKCNSAACSKMESKFLRSHYLSRTYISMKYKLNVVCDACRVLQCPDWILFQHCQNFTHYSFLKTFRIFVLKTETH